MTVRLSCPLFDTRPLIPLLRISMVLAGLLGTGQSWAAVPVEDMSTRDIRSSALTEQVPLSGAGAAGAGLPGGAAADAATNPGQNAQLFYELQVLQSELQQLRGLVEDQAYEISRLRDLQRSQYLDIDRRLIEDGHPVAQISAPPTGPAAQAPVREPVVQVQTAQGSTGSQQPVVESSVAVTAAALPAPTPVLETATTPAATNPEAKPGSETETQLVPSEQLAFERAFELMKEQQFEQSITAYQRVVEGFPDGNYAPESRYWLGELYLMSDRLEAARGSFASVVEVYPAHQKVPLSLYKLGVVNHRLGATPAALEYLDNVVTRYPDTPAAGLARTYAAELR